MKKILLGISAIGMSLVLTACGTSANDAAINGLSKQLDDTSNTLSDFAMVNPSDLSMSKSTLDAMATTDSSIYDNIISTQQALLNEEYYKADILSRTAKVKNCLSKDLTLSKAQISAVKDLTNNLEKYTNSVSYTKNELTSAVKAVSNMKKNTEKNADKISAKLNRIACNSNTRMAYYENIINTLNQLETFLCCEDCETPDQNKENANSSTQSETNSTQTNSSQSTNQNSTNNTTQNNTSDNKTSKGLPINIDTYAPTNRNIDTIAYNNMYNNRFANNYARGYGYGGYGAPYGANGYAFNNGYGAYGPQPYPAYGYNMAYNANNINRVAYPAVPVAEMNESYKKTTQTNQESTAENVSAIKNTSTDTKINDNKKLENNTQTQNNLNTAEVKEVANTEKRLEDFEEIKDGELQKVESKTQQIEDQNKESSVSANTDSLENKAKNAVNKTSEEVKDFTEKTGEKVKNSAKKMADKALNVSARETKQAEPIKDNRTSEEIQRDLDQPIIAHQRPMKDRTTKR